MQKKRTSTKSLPITNNIWDLQGCKIVALGDGRIIVESKVHNAGFPMGYLSLFSSKRKRKVGETIKKDSKYDNKLPDISISFYNIESVDVMLKSLKRIKSRMRQINKKNQRGNLVLKNTKNGWELDEAKKVVYS